MAPARIATSMSVGRVRHDCPICASSNLKYDFLIDGHPAYSCQSCSLLFLNPAPRSASEAAAVPGAPIASAVDETDAYEVHAANAASALDRLLRYAAIAEGRLLLVDPTPHIEAEARRRGLEVVIRSARSLECGAPAEMTGTVHACLLHRVLETVDDPLAVLTSIRSLLTPGGCLMVVSPTLDSRAARFFRSWWWEFRKENRFYFSTDTLQNILLRAGYGDPIVVHDETNLSLRYLRHKLSVMPSTLRYRLLRWAVALAPRFLGTRAFRFLHSRTAILVRTRPHHAPARLSVVMPVYNERNTFTTVMEQLLAKRLDNVEMEIIVVESNSTDGTRELARQYEHHPRVQLILEDRPRGKGHAVRSGFEAATGDVILIQDADLEYDIDDYDSLVTPIVQYEQNFVIGSRHILKGRVWKIREFNDAAGFAAVFNFGHLIFLALFNVIYRQRLKDPFSMYKVFRRDCLYGLSFECNRFDFDFELTIKLLRKGYRPLELPVNYKARSFSEGKKVTIIRDPLTWLRALIKFRWSPLYGRNVR
jgi:SAM-dependent methyltransferase